MVNVILCGPDPTKQSANTAAGPDSAVPRNYMLPTLAQSLCSEAIWMESGINININQYLLKLRKPDLRSSQRLALNLTFGALHVHA